MQPAILISLYFAVGLVCAGFVFFPAPERNAQVVASALASLVLWPLWGPFALHASTALPRGPAASRIAAALEGALDKGAAAPRGALLNRGETALLVRQVEAAERRLAELEAQLTVLGDEDAVSEPGGSDARARAQIRASSRAQLQGLRDREHGALLELAELCELLRAQHLLNRFGGSERTAELRDELWAQVQALSELER